MKRCKYETKKEREWVRNAKKKEKVIETIKTGKLKGASVVRVGKYKYLRSPNKCHYILM